METAVQDFLDSVYVRSHSDETVKTYGNCIKKFKQFLSSKYEIDLDQTVSKIKEEELDVFKMFNEFVVFQELQYCLFLDIVGDHQPLLQESCVLQIVI